MRRTSHLPHFTTTTTTSEMWLDDLMWGFSRSMARIYTKGDAFTSRSEHWDKQRSKKRLLSLPLPPPSSSALVSLPVSWSTWQTRWKKNNHETLTATTTKRKHTRPCTALLYLFTWSALSSAEGRGWSEEVVSALDTEADFNSSSAMKKENTEGWRGIGYMIPAWPCFLVETALNSSIFNPNTNTNSNLNVRSMQEA